MKILDLSPYGLIAKRTTLGMSIPSVKKIVAHSVRLGESDARESDAFGRNLFSPLRNDTKNSHREQKRNKRMCSFPYLCYIIEVIMKVY